MTRLQAGICFCTSKAPMLAMSRLPRCIATGSVPCLNSVAPKYGLKSNSGPRPATEDVPQDGGPNVLLGHGVGVAQRDLGLRHGGQAEAGGAQGGTMGEQVAAIDMMAHGVSPVVHEGRRHVAAIGRAAPSAIEMYRTVQNDQRRSAW